SDRSSACASSSRSRRRARGRVSWRRRKEKSVARVKVLFDGPGPQANGLAADQDGLWVSDQKDNRIYKVRYQDGSVITSFATPARNLSGCGFGGGAGWGGSNHP